MLKEEKNVRQNQSEGRRRWFYDNYFDLITWQDADNEISSFQLCYDKGISERVLTWQKHKGYSHNKIDDGEVPGEHKMTPILAVDGKFDKSKIMEKFENDSKEIDRDIAQFVYKKLLHHPALK
jgi:hypothetical protein